MNHEGVDGELLELRVSAVHTSTGSLLQVEGLRSLRRYIRQLQEPRNKKSKTPRKCRLEIYIIAYSIDVHRPSTPYSYAPPSITSETPQPTCSPLPIDRVPPGYRRADKLSFKQLTRELPAPSKSHIRLRSV